MSYQNRHIGVSETIYTLLFRLNTQTYQEIVPKLEYWIEFAFSQQFTTIAKLVEHVSAIVWAYNKSPESIARFLKEFRGSPRQSAHARSFVDELCTRAFWWFTAASAEDLDMSWRDKGVAKRGGSGFVDAAAFVGRLIECDLLNHNLVRQHLIKPLITHYYPNPGMPQEIVRTNAIFQLLFAAGNTLVEGLLEPDDARICFEILETQLSKPDVIARLSTTKLEELRGLPATWSRRNDRDVRDDGAGAEEREEGEDDATSAGTAVEVETPIAFAPHDLPPTGNFGIPSPIFQAFEPSAALHNVDPSPDALTEDLLAPVSSPTLSISTISDLTPTEFDEDIGESSDERVPIHHETFYLEDGNVEIMCGQTIFRVHSPVISFSCHNLRNILSSSALLGAPMPEGCPRVAFKDDPEDFSVLLKMIYTPGFLVRNKIPNFTTFASLLRMTSKYGFPDIREALVDELKGAYPTKWEEFETAKVLGEDVFGSPKPHPNAVLNLFLGQQVKFALPFAAYRAGLGGPSTLASERPGVTLPRLTLASIIHGVGGVRRAMTYAMQTLVFTRDPEVCSERACAMYLGVTSTERTEALKTISGVIVKRSEGDPLSPLSFENLLCANCARPLVSAHREYRRRLVWERLPNLIGWESWEGV